MAAPRAWTSASRSAQVAFVSRRGRTQAALAVAGISRWGGVGRADGRTDPAQALISAAQAIKANQGLGQRLIDSAMRSDRDGNKTISRAEAPRWLRRTFDSVDANSDGEIDQKELEQAIAKIRGRR